MHSIWLVITALAAFLVAYRFYGAFLAARVAVLNDRRITPAHRLRDDVDYHPTRRLVLFGVHFAAIAGSGPLVGPVLASQFGYFPGFCWIVIGSCLAGGVHDFVVLLASVRHDGKSLPRIARDMLGPYVGAATTIATLFIIITTLAATGKVVVNALNESAWGMFTIVVTIPAALLTGFWMNKIRPGRIGEASLIGVTLVVLGVVVGQRFDDSTYRHLLVFSVNDLAVILPIYAAVVSILPVWVLLTPRDYLSSYMKVSVIALLGVGILVANPTLKMPAMTPFVGGDGPIFGTVWPFVCIVIACGALSGFHALIASGTTPKMVDRESDIRPIGYGAMLLEGFVSLTALIAACSLEPGDYFKVNTEPTQYRQLIARTQKQFGWDLLPRELARLKEEAGVKEELAGRTAGAVTLALGMAKVLGDLPGMRALMAYLYHFVIMFEALFILTLLETGTRVARFILQDALSGLQPGSLATDVQVVLSWVVNALVTVTIAAACACLLLLFGVDRYWFSNGIPNAVMAGIGLAYLGAATTYLLRGTSKMNVATSLLVCGLWGYLLYNFEIGRLWLMNGIGNQLLAAIGLGIGTTYLLQHSPKRAYALCTAIPFAAVATTVYTAGAMSVYNWWQMQADPTQAATAGSNRLMCALVTAILLLGGVILVAMLRRWAELLLRGSPEREHAAGETT
ncbi:MAG: carbon starvation CstA family protein [Thermoguttaceae bacterium]